MALYIIIHRASAQEYIYDAKALCVYVCYLFCNGSDKRIIYFIRPVA